MDHVQIEIRRRKRQQLLFNAAVLIRDKLGGSMGPIEERLEHVRVAALSATADAGAALFALRMKGIITAEEEQVALDASYQLLLEKIQMGLGKVFWEG